MIRDRVEIIIDAISSGKKIENPRSRIEAVFSKIAEKIGELSEGSSSAGMSKTLLGEFSQAQDTYIVDSMSDYEIIMIEMCLNDSYGAFVGNFTTILTSYYEEGKIISGAMATSSSPNQTLIVKFDNATTIRRSSASNAYIRRVYGVK